MAQNDRRGSSNEPSLQNEQKLTGELLQEPATKKVKLSSDTNMTRQLEQILPVQDVQRSLRTGFSSTFTPCTTPNIINLETTKPILPMSSSSTSTPTSSTSNTLKKSLPLRKRLLEGGTAQQIEISDTPQSQSQPQSHSQMKPQTPPQNSFHSEFFSKSPQLPQSSSQSQLQLSSQVLLSQSSQLHPQYQTLSLLLTQLQMQQKSQTQSQTLTPTQLTQLQSLLRSQPQLVSLLSRSLTSSQNTSVSNSTSTQVSASQSTQTQTKTPSVSAEQAKSQAQSELSMTHSGGEKQQSSQQKDSKSSVGRGKYQRTNRSNIAIDLTNLDVAPIRKAKLAVYEEAKLLDDFDDANDDEWFESRRRSTSRGKLREDKDTSYEDDEVPVRNKTDNESEEVYCLCRRPQQGDEPMIGCDVCDEWYHFECVGLTLQDARLIDRYVCPVCERREKEKERRKLLLSDVKCSNPRCNNFARVKSRYCSHECGIICALPKAEEELRTEAELQKFIHEYNSK